MVRFPRVWIKEEVERSVEEGEPDDLEERLKPCGSAFVGTYVEVVVVLEEFCNGLTCYDQDGADDDGRPLDGACPVQCTGFVH